MIKEGDLVIIDTDNLSEKQMSNISHNFGGFWIFGKPMKVIDAYGDHIDTTVMFEGIEYPGYWREGQVKPAKDEVRSELLKIKEEIDV